MSDASLSRSLAIGTAALRTHAEAFERVANNVANVNTPGFTADRPHYIATQEGVRLSQSATRNAESSSANGASDVDLAREIVDSVEIRQGYRAALEIVKTADKLLEETLKMV